MALFKFSTPNNHKLKSFDRRPRLKKGFSAAAARRCRDFLNVTHRGLTTLYYTISTFLLIYARSAVQHTDEMESVQRADIGILYQPSHTSLVKQLCK